jgi:transcriptional regulator with PAS, ATPase and Fis domain
MPAISLSDDAVKLLINYRWPGNIRQLKNIAEQISVIETKREIDSLVIHNYLPDHFEEKLPAIYDAPIDQKTFNNEREILYKILFDMKSDMNDLKKLVFEIMQKDGSAGVSHEHSAQIIKNLYESETPVIQSDELSKPSFDYSHRDEDIQDTEEIIEESLSLEEKEKELITKALRKHGGKRKHAALDLGISERTLYRKIKEYDLNEE